MNFYEAWWWLFKHPMNNRDGMPMGMYDLDIFVARVNPFTNKIENAENLNTSTRIWLEFGPYGNEEEDITAPEFVYNNRTHDPRLDCGGASFEEAIIKLQNLVLKYYGDYEDV